MLDDETDYYPNHAEMIVGNRSGDEADEALVWSLLGQYEQAHDNTGDNPDGSRNEAGRAEFDRVQDETRNILRARFGTLIADPIYDGVENYSVAREPFRHPSRTSRLGRDDWPARNRRATTMTPDFHELIGWLCPGFTPWATGTMSEIIDLNRVDIWEEAATCPNYAEKWKIWVHQQAAMMRAHIKQHGPVTVKVTPGSVLWGPDR